MRKATKETTKKESTKKQKTARVRPEVLAKTAETPVVVEPAEALAAEPAIEAAEVVVPEPADAEVPVGIPPDGESADTPASETASETPPVVPADVPTESPTDPEPPVDLDALRESVEKAKAALEAAKADTKQLVEHARAVVIVADDDYRRALAPYREACRKAGQACEFEGGRGAIVAARVGFLVERTADGVCITIRGRPETMETVPLSVLKESVGKVAYSYCDRWIGPKGVIGNKGGGLGNRIRAALK
ncbi:MAG: hypothetical protein MUE73_21555 [Planctomycetes bacterium]|nr:hypothetical protein [Planctomycetota bacterium]